MSFKLYYHPEVKNTDISQLNEKLKSRIKNAVETRLATSPHLYGEPLRKTLRGYWKLRVGDLRVVYKIVDNEVWILGIIHRKKVYNQIKGRL